MSNQNPHPHLGNLIRAYMTNNRISKAEAGRKLGVTTTEVVKYLKRPSLQFHVLWNFCIALQHDFLADLQVKLPEHFPRSADPKIEDLQKEIEIFERLLRDRLK
ncbi:hypothetical protein CBW16_07655 [Flavobacteriaceae bacterium JJC]|nr:hypothetical protein CBW16_07655 [Flavobacteriaceae bacterium JJC]